MKKSVNEIRTIGNIAYMALYNRKNKVINITIFDTKFIGMVRDFRWSSYKHRNTRYVTTNLNKEQKEIHGIGKLRLHKLILPCKKPLMIDHENHDGLDNRLENLRVVSNRVNCENRGTRSNKSGFVGVSRHRRDCVWQSCMQINGKNKYIGSFKTKEEAFEAREKYKLDNNIG